MAKEEKKAPKLRFNGYTNDWERKKLGNVAENLSYGLNLPSTNYDGNNIYLRITDIDDESHTLNRDNLTSPNLGKFDKNILDYKLTENDVVFARTGASVGKTYVYTPTDGNIYFAGFLVRAKFKSSILANFVFYTTLTSKYLNYVKVTSQRSGQPGVNAKEYGNFAISITDSTEQFRIISLLKKLDGTINLHERKCEELALIKKALLQKLFPKKDEIKPEVRYKNFSDAWEQRKLGDISKTKRGLTYKPSNIDNTGIHVLRSSNIKEDTFVISDNDVFVKESAVNIPFVKNGDILITAANGSTNLVGKHAIIRDIPKNSAVHGGFMLITTSKEYEFLNASMSSNWYKKFIKKYVAGGNGAIGNLRKNDLDNQKIYVPKKDEQEKIGNFFKMLDSLITLHQRKLERLKQLKKFLLQNMFI